MKPKLLILQIVFVSSLANAQPRPIQPSSVVVQKDAVQPEILMKNIGNDIVQFSAILPPLRQLAGAPKAYYSYFWDFGDGSFNDVNLIDRDKPKHRYAKSGDYQVRLLATNNYASGISPTVVKVCQVKVTTTSTNKLNTDFFADKEKASNIKIKVNRNPKPQEDLMAYIGYRNRLGNNTSGSIVIFFNDQRFIHKSFGLTDKRTYNGEQSSSLDRLASNSIDPENSNPDIFTAGHQRQVGLRMTALNTRSEAAAFFALPRETNNKLATLRKKYLDYTVFTYNNLQRDDQHFIFMKLQTLPDIIKDTNEVISMTAMMIPDDHSVLPEQYDLTIQVLASHDPNQMHLLQNRINYRFMKKKKELTYQVDFQNIGKGPARNITLGISLPKQLNGASLQINEVSPKLQWCDSISATDESCMDTIRTGDSLRLLIKNIYLPGLEQNLVKNEDSTKGFIRYTIRFAKKPKKVPFSSRASIKFDNNAPIQTNQATARFIKGLSPGIVAGYNFALSNGRYSASGPVQIGYILAPYAPSRPYFQVEIYAGILQTEKNVSGKYRLTQTELNTYAENYNKSAGNYTITVETGDRDTAYSRKRNVMQFVPLHFRYNLNNWVSIGIGLSGQLVVSEKLSAVENRNYHGSYVATTGTTAGNKNYEASTATAVIPKSGSETKTFTSASLAPFADIQVGRVRNTGPIFGARYYRQLQGNIDNQFFIYTGFKL